MSQVSGYRMTAADLPDADQKTLRGLGPLLEALNRCLSSVIVTLNALALPTLKATSFTTDTAGSAYVDLKLTATPSELWVTALLQAGGPINFVWSWSWIPLSQGARVYFVGLGVSTTYALKVRWL